MQIDWDGSTTIDQIVTHRHDTDIVYEGSGAQRCDIAVWVRRDHYDNHPGNECGSVDYLLALDDSNPVDHGGHIDFVQGLGNTSRIVLAGLTDSADPLAANALLDKTGTYSLCLAKYVPGDYSDCTTWTPTSTDNYTFYENVQCADPSLPMHLPRTPLTRFCSVQASHPA